MTLNLDITNSPRIELDDWDTGEQENKEFVAFQQVKQLAIHMDLL